MSIAFNLLKSFFMFLGFFLISLFGEKYKLNIYFMNFLFTVTLIAWYNPFGVDKNKRLIFFEIGSILGLLSYLFIPDMYLFFEFILLLLIMLFLGIEKNDENYAKILIFIASFFNLSFVSATKINVIQYDFSSCYNYFEYILENNFLFWKENPLLSRPSYSSYHPILHFFLTAVGIRFGELIGFTRNIVSEAVQILFISYMFGYYVVVSKILKLLDFKGSVYLCCLGFVLFFSLNFAISGFVNNDGLLLFWQSLVIYYSLLYYKEEKFSYALKTALFVGLALLTKFSGILVLGGVGIVFLEKLYKNRDKKTFIEVFSISLLILIGILIWPLYQYFVLNINYDFVPPQEHLSIAKYSFFERFTPIKAIFYEDMFYSGYESNLWETLTKTALFGQWNFSYRGRDILNLIILFVYLYKAIILMVIFGFFFIVIKNRKDFITYFIVFLTFNIIGGLICFVIKHPYTCNQDFRYIAIFTLVMAMILGKTFMLLAKRIRNAGIVVISLFEALSLFIWWSVIW